MSSLSSPRPEIFRPHVQDSWEQTGIQYRGYPVYYCNKTVRFAYEADYERLVDLPEAVQYTLQNVLLLDSVLPELSAAAWTELRRAAH